MIPVANIQVGTFTFEGVFDKVNELAGIITLGAVTANSTLGLNEGNAYLDGTFSAETLVANVAVRGGNSSVSQPLPVGDDGIHTGRALSYSAQTSTTNTDLQAVDSYLLSSYRSSSYLLQVVSSVGVQSSRVMVTHDGTTAYSTEYSTLQSNGSLGVFSVSTNSTAVALQFTPTNPTNVVRFLRTSLEA